MIFIRTGARVCVRQNYYSVPARYAGRRLPVLSATAVDVLDWSPVAARHERAAGKTAGSWSSTITWRYSGGERPVGPTHLTTLVGI
jgi:hypothetical protein